MQSADQSEMVQLCIAACFLKIQICFLLRKIKQYSKNCTLCSLFFFWKEFPKNCSDFTLFGLFLVRIWQARLQIRRKAHAAKIIVKSKCTERRFI